MDERTRRFYRNSDYDMGEDVEVLRESNIGHAVLDLLEKARAGDRHAQKQVMFPFRYGHKRDEETGEFRPYTPEELDVVWKDLIG